MGTMCAAALLDAGAAVTITSRRARAETAFDTLSKLGPVNFIQVDLAAPGGVESLLEGMASGADGLDILINNAGVTWGAPMEDYPAEAWDKVLRLDVAVPFRLAVGLLPLLRAASRSDRPARIVNIGSVDGHAVGPFDNFAYAAAKAGLHQLTRVLAFRLARSAITVNAIAPGPIHSKMTEALIERSGEALLQASPLGRLAGPDDVAGALVFLCADSGSYVTGAIIPVDGGLALGPWSHAADDLS